MIIATANEDGGYWLLVLGMRNKLSSTTSIPQTWPGENHSSYTGYPGS